MTLTLEQWATRYGLSVPQVEHLLESIRHRRDGDRITIGKYSLKWLAIRAGIVAANESRLPERLRGRVWDASNPEPRPEVQVVRANVGYRDAG